LIIKDIHIIILIGVIFLTAVVAVWGTIRFAIPNLKESLSKVVKRMNQLERSEPKHMTRDDFDNEIQRINQSRMQHRLSCQAQLGARIEELKADLKVFDRCREDAKREMITRADFEEHKRSTKEDMSILFDKVDKGQQLLARLDERIKIFITNNGNKK